MLDSPYDTTNVTPELRPVFDQLQRELGTQYEIWVRVEDFGRSVTAGIVNRASSIAVTVPLTAAARRVRTVLEPSELDHIRKHLASAATKDLSL